MAITDMFSSSSEGSGMDDMCGGFQLTRTQRFYGFGICFAAGCVISVLSSFILAMGNITGFAVLYTVGNIISLLSTGFLVGFMAQFKKMFDNTRIIASCVFLVSMVATLVVAFTLNSWVLTLICCIFEFLALFWYSASYIPFLRDIIKKCAFGWMGA